MTLDEAYPALPLRECVRYYQQRRARIPGTAVVYPIVARPEQFIEFYLRGRYLVRSVETGSVTAAPSAVVVGPSTRRNVELVLCDVLEVFTIQFQAAGFFRLFRTPMRDLADRAYEARSIIGPIASQMEQRLGEAVSFEERTRIANEFLLRRLEEEGAADRVFGIANRFLAEDGALSVRKAAATAGLSVRQFERRFAEQVGLPPKPYARIVRFNAALQAKASVPQRRWTNIAHEFGYFDQMHMIRDFERLAGETPTAFQQRRDALTWA